MRHTLGRTGLYGFFVGRIQGTSGVARGSTGGRGAGLRLSGGPMPAEPREGSDTVVFDDMRELPDLLTGR
ncbi:MULTISPECIES: hypothetical protein [Streptomyces]|uniref:Uncharacterized protein n=1 Tax=Streptomyces durocortorensis TaxID=2811104 RepID=A0ABS2I0N9_9ACTN|nr:hypothetical protein [Streptomyces durocortorensis]MBM7055724.1 hypothetical protein [Streptomyces durocortorensis]